MTGLDAKIESLSMDSSLMKTSVEVDLTNNDDAISQVTVQTGCIILDDWHLSGK